MEILTTAEDEREHIRGRVGDGGKGADGWEWGGGWTFSGSSPTLVAGEKKTSVGGAIAI